MTHLQHLSETAPAARRWPVLEDAAPATAAAAQAPGPSAAGGARSAADADQLAEPGAVQPSGQQVPGAADVSLAGTGLRCRGQQEQPQQQMGPQPATSAATATARGQAAATDEGKEVVKPGAPAGPGTAGAAPPAATSAAAASWHSPLTQFEPGFERRSVVALCLGRLNSCRPLCCAHGYLTAVHCFHMWPAGVAVSTRAAATATVSYESDQGPNNLLL